MRLILSVASIAHGAPTSITLVQLKASGLRETSLREVLTGPRPGFLLTKQIAPAQELALFLASARHHNVAPIFWFRDAVDFATRGFIGQPRPALVLIGSGKLSFGRTTFALDWSAKQNLSEPYLFDISHREFTGQHRGVSPLCSNAFEIGDWHLNPGWHRF